MNRTSAYALIALFTLLFVILFGGSSQLAAYRNPAPALMLTSSITPIPATAFIYLSLPVFLVCAARRMNLAAQWLFFLLLTSELLIASVAYQLYPVHVDFTQPYTPQDGWQTLLRIAHAIGMSHNYLPSLHCAFATTAAAVLHGAIARQYRPLVWLYAAAINISTLTIHAHHPLDVLTGNLLVLLLWYPVRHWARRSFSGYQAHALWLHNQVQFARRHRRYALISFILYSQYLAHPKRSRLMIAGYCFLQAYDDIMDGDRALIGSLKNAITPQQHAADIMRQWQGYTLRQPENEKQTFQAASDGAGAWGAGQPEKPLSDLPALADLFNQQLARLPSYTEAHAEVVRLLQLMQADAVRAQARQLYPQAQLQRHLQQTFISSLNLLFHAQQSTTRAEHIPQLAHALAWCSITRDWDDDLAHGIINIPAEVWHAAALAADERDGRDGRVISRNPVIAAWLAEQKQRAEQDLREVFFRLPQIKRQDPAAAQIIGLFARSVQGFARKRYLRRFEEE